MRGIVTFFAAFVVMLAANAATTFNFNSDSSVNQTVDGFTVVIAKGSGNNDPAYYANGLRLYAGNTITVSGGNLTKLSISFSKQGSKAYADLTSSAGVLTSGGVSTAEADVVTDVWTGNVESVTFTVGTGQRLIKELVVNGDASGSTDPSTPGGGDGGDSSLDPDYVYDEPTVVGVPSMTVQGEAYSFVSNNIEVSATKGAITDSYFSAHADFALTFTATQPIKGIVINGFVKKGFTATASAGKIEYLTPAADTDGNPVVVLTDVNSTTVTISCVKQLRCYSVEVYFNENPDAEVSGGSGENSEDLVFDTAEAVYESAYVEILGEENYSIFLYNEASYDYPYVALDIYPESRDNLTGTYNMADYTLGDYTYYLWGEGDNDMAWAEDGQAVITQNGDVYTITGYMKCDNNVTYRFSFTGKLPIYLDSDYYGDGEDGSGVNDAVLDGAELDENAPMYNLIGHKVGRSYKGIIIQNGRKFMNR